MSGEELYNTIVREITPLTDEDCLFIADRKKKEFDYPVHTHDDYELNFIMNAAGATRVVGDSQEAITDFDLVLITGANLEHAWFQGDCRSDRDIREITIQFRMDFDGAFLRGHQFKSIKKMIQKAQNGLVFPLEAVLEVYTDLDKLTEDNQGFDSVMRFLSVLNRLSHYESRVLSVSSSIKMGGRSSDSKRATLVQSYINENYMNNITLEMVSEMAGLTPVAFSRYFKQHTGKTVSDYIIDVRLGQASRMLVNSDDSIGDIGRICGFNNLSNFNRIFKKKKDCTPKEFRERYRKKITRV